MGLCWVRFDMEGHTAILELSFEQLNHGLWMAFALFVAFDDLTELGNPFVEWVKIALIIHRRFVHVVQDLLHGRSQISASDSYYQWTRYEGRERNPSDGRSTHPHRCDLGISRRTFLGLSDGHEKQRK